MWHDCPTEQDEPITLPWGVQFSDFAMAVGVYLFFFIVLHRPTSGLPVAAAVLLGLRKLKTGKPPGAHWHWLHMQELFHISAACRPHERRYRIW
jgi:hypothetical protein